jgi:23S rRNA (cytosine1962-C5)-methyltransferase
VHANTTYQLVDFGEGARLERFGDRLVDRPYPAALGARRSPDAWRAADLRFDRDRGWSGAAAGAGPWPVELGGTTLELRPTEAGQLGVFPEHAAMLPWLRARIDGRLQPSGADGPRPAVLHLFAYTGLVTLALAAAGAAVAHLDSARPTVAWARRNAERSGLAERPIRWIVDDAAAFTGREARRGRRYAGLVLDPPSYGHAAAGRAWRIEDDLEPLLVAAAGVLDPDGFVLLTAHTPGFDPERLALTLGRVFRRRPDAVESGSLDVATDDGRRLELSAFARTAGGA